MTLSIPTCMLYSDPVSNYSEHGILVDESPGIYGGDRKSLNGSINLYQMKGPSLKLRSNIHLHRNKELLFTVVT